MASSSDEYDGIAHIPPMGSAGLRIVLQDISQQWLETAPPVQDIGNVERLPTFNAGDVEENVTEQVLGQRSRNRILLTNNQGSSSGSGPVAIVDGNNEVILIEDTEPQEAQLNGTTPTSSRKRRR